MKKITILLMCCLVLTSCGYILGMKYTYDITILPESDPFTPVFKVSTKTENKPVSIRNFFVIMNSDSERENVWACSLDPCKESLISEIKYGETPDGWQVDIKAKQLLVGPVYTLHIPKGDYASNLSFRIIEAEGGYKTQIIE